MRAEGVPDEHQGWGGFHRSVVPSESDVRVPKRMMVAAMAAVVVLPVSMGATSPGTAAEVAGVGDASTSLLGLELDVDDVDGVVGGALGGLLGEVAALDTLLDLGLLEGVTSATTRGTPDALASLVPVRLGSQQPMAVEAQGNQTSTDPGGSVPSLPTLVRGLVVTGDLQAHAQTTAETAAAWLGDVTTSVDLLRIAGVDLTSSGIRSEVTRTASVATQGLSVDDLHLSLGDLLPAELLERLPLSALLDLLEAGDLAGLVSLPDDLRAQLETAVADATAAIEGLDAPLAAVEALAGGPLDTDVLADLLALQTVVADLGAQLTAVEGAGTADLLTILTAAITSVSDPVLDTVGLDASSSACSPSLGSLLDPLALLTARDSLVECLEGLLTQATDLEGGLLNDLLGDLGDVAAALDALRDALGVVETALGLVRDLVGQAFGGADGLASAPLLAVDRITAQLDATAASTGGTTGVACGITGIQVLGQVLPPLDCATLGSDAGAGALPTAVNEALAAASTLLLDLLETLPGVSVTSSGPLLELLPAWQESVVEDADGTVRATSELVLLAAEVPSVTIDPSAVIDTLLDLPALPANLTTTVTSLVGSLDAALGGIGLTELTAPLVEVGQTASAITAQLPSLVGLLDDLDLPSLLAPITTPGLRLVIDPVSTATFTPAADPVDPEPVDPEPVDPEPADPEPATPTPPLAAPRADPPALPKTGGAPALLGLLALAGAAALRRR